MMLLILSDVHANWPALQAVLRAEPDFDAVVFCGDAVDYGPQPVECVQWLQDNVLYAVRGNHDNALAFNLDCRCRRLFRACSEATRAWHRTLLSPADRAWLGGLPTLDWFEWQGRHFRMAHATPQGDIYEYLPESAWQERVAGLDQDFVLLGHTHLQGIRTFGKLTVVNPGSVGLAHDHPGQACYAVWNGRHVVLKRTPYDVEETLAALHRGRLPGQVIDRLALVLGAAA
jgi:putative phosphoesterase